MTETRIFILHIHNSLQKLLSDFVAARRVRQLLHADMLHYAVLIALTHTGEVLHPVLQFAAIFGVWMNNKHIFICHHQQ